jgi:hypothetical protein
LFIYSFFFFFFLLLLLLLDSDVVFVLAHCEGRLQCTL